MDGRPPDAGTGTGVALVVAGAALFGTLGIFGELARAVGLSTATLLGGRFLAATAILWGYLARRGYEVRLAPRTLAAELGLGLVYGLMSIAYFESLAWLSAGVATLVLFTYPVQVTLVSAVTLDESVTVPKTLALAAGLGGVALVAGGGVAFGLPGFLLVGVASLAYTVYSIGTRVMVATVRPLVHAAYVFLGVTAAVLLYGVGTGTLTVPTAPADWGLIAGITVVGTLFPMILFTAGLARIPASTASIVSTSEPLTTVVLGIVLLSEPLTPAIAVGGAVSSRASSSRRRRPSASSATGCAGAGTERRGRTGERVDGGPPERTPGPHADGDGGPGPEPTVHPIREAGTETDSGSHHFVVRSESFERFDAARNGSCWRRWHATTSRPRRRRRRSDPEAPASKPG
ncbi:DMT family transporter [Haloplanus natans]|uniref:DMT family transporter n=1 Tax=Haloplanus natans TaxID=376171 RepID=UPI0006783388|nr:DMT family transporter [Haloplanus natans]